MLETMPRSISGLGAFVKGNKEYVKPTSVSCRAPGQFIPTGPSPFEQTIEHLNPHWVEYTWGRCSDGGIDLNVDCPAGYQGWWGRNTGESNPDNIMQAACERLIAEPVIEPPPGPVPASPDSPMPVVDLPAGPPPPPDDEQAQHFEEGAEKIVGAMKLGVVAMATIVLATLAVGGYAIYKATR